MRTSRTEPGITTILGLIFGTLALATFSTGCSERGVKNEERVRSKTTSTPGARGTPAPIETASFKAITDIGQELPETVGDTFPSQSVTPPLDPGQVRTAWLDGVSLFEQGDYVAACTNLQIAADNRPEEPYSHSLLGLAYLKSGQPGKAEESLMRSASIDPEHVRTWTNLARVRLDRDDPEGALNAIGTALQIEPESSDALHQLGRALVSLGRGDEALEVLTRARGFEPDNGYIANTLGYLLILQENPEEALSHLEFAGETLPGVSYIHNNLGVAYERTGQVEKAFREYRAAVDSGDPDGKATASIARIEPVVQRVIAAKGVDTGTDETTGDTIVDQDTGGPAEDEASIGPITSGTGATENEGEQEDEEEVTRVVSSEESPSNR